MRELSYHAALQALRKHESTGECLVLYRYEWHDAKKNATQHVGPYWAHVRYEDEDEDHLDRWIEISADDEIDLDNVLAVAPLPEVEA